jgi:hypothetical protein
MALHGWEAQAEQLSMLAARGGWGEIAAVITDELLNEFVVEGSWDDIGGKVRAKYEGLADRLALYLPFSLHEVDANWMKVVRAVRG